MATKKKAAKKKRARPRESFGALMLSVRVAEDLTLDAMGARLGASRGALCDVEKDRRVPSAALAARWAEALGYDARPFVQQVLQAQLDQAGLKMRVTVG